MPSNNPNRKRRKRKPITEADGWPALSTTSHTDVVVLPLLTNPA
jgi:hypothetical protein